MNVALSNTFGFGGHNACVLFKKMTNLNGVKILDYIRNSRMEHPGIFLMNSERKLENQNFSSRTLSKKLLPTALLILKNSAGEPVNFERLEFLGDAILIPL